MVAILCLCTCALATGQPAGGSEWFLLPSLGRGQELVYRGTFEQEALGLGVQFTQRYGLESRVFVLDVSPKGSDVAFLTVYRQSGHRPETGDPPDPASVRLELGKVDPVGRATASSGKPPSLPLDGPPTVECGAFVPVPRDRVGLDQTWTAAELGRPAQTWQVIGTDAVNGTTCLKLAGVQQSDDWDQPRADRGAWRRRDTVWMIPRLGVAYKVERVIEQREPARKDPGQRSVMRYELENSMVYPGQLFTDYRNEILQARAFTGAADPCLREPARYGLQLQSILVKIGTHLDNAPSTPYRTAVLQVKRRIEAARRGELPPPEVPEAAAGPPAVADLDQTAPDFVVTDLTKNESARLRRFLGRPILMVFYSPSSTTVEDVLHFAQKAGDDHAAQVTVLALAMSDDRERILKQRADLAVKFPILIGTGLRRTYAVDATPKFVVVDAGGTVRGAFTGWGRETPDAVLEELKRWTRGK